jgi:hypothetical protein
MKRSAKQTGSDTRKDAVRHPDWFDMQGLVLSAYPDQDQAQYLLYSINPGKVDGARLWLNRILTSITPASKYTHTDSRSKINIALTATGLAKLVGPDSEATSTPSQHGCRVFPTLSSKALRAARTDRASSATPARTIQDAGRGAGRNVLSSMSC